MTRSLRELLPAARAKHRIVALTKNGVIEQLPHEIQLREMPDGECQVIRFYHPKLIEELKQFPYEHGAYVIERGRSWKELGLK